MKNLALRAFLPLMAAILLYGCGGDSSGSVTAGADPVRLLAAGQAGVLGHRAVPLGHQRA